MTPKLPEVPSGNLYCRMCFSDTLYKFVSREEAGSWVEYLSKNAGVRLVIEEDAPFGLCYACVMTLKSVESFREQCQRCDLALKTRRSLSKAQPATEDSGSTSEPEALSIQILQESEESIQPSVAEAKDDGEDSSLTRAGNHGQSYMCYACEITVSNKTEHLSHFLREHPKIKGYVNCPDCSNKFRQYENFNKHMQRHARKKRNKHTDGQSRTCNICSQTFISPSAKSLHQKKIHKLKFECQGCYQRFATKRARSEHMLSHQSVKLISTEHHCKFCPKMFPSMRGLVLHQQKHKRRLECGTCGQKYPTFKEYMAHQHGEHEVQEMADIFHCLSCVTVFCSRRTFELHLNRKHVSYDIIEDHVKGDTASQSNEVKKVVAKNDETASKNLADVEKNTSQEKPIDSIKHEGEAEQSSISHYDYPYDNDDEVNNDDLERDLILQEAPAIGGFDLYGSAFRSIQDR